MAALRSGYRGLLKAIDKHVTSKAGNTDVRDHVAALFRATGDKALEGEDEAAALAKDAAFLINGIHEHRELLLSYNITVDRTAEQAERLKNTAERVGLGMPELYEEPK